MSKNIFSQLFHSPLALSIQPYIVSSIDFSFKILFIDWQKCGFWFYLNISKDLSLYLCLSLSLGCASLKCDSPFYESVIHRVYLSTSTVGMYTFSFRPNLMQMASMILVCLVYIQSV